jgi:hypothetical protein
MKRDRGLNAAIRASQLRLPAISGLFGRQFSLAFLAMFRIVAKILFRKE